MKKLKTQKNKITNRLISGLVVICILLSPVQASAFSLASVIESGENVVGFVKNIFNNVENITAKFVDKIEASFTLNNRAQTANTIYSNLDSSPNLPANSTSTSSPTYITQNITNPVVERVIEKIASAENLVTVGYLESVLSQTNNKFAMELAQKINNLSSGSNTPITNVYQQIAHTNKIDQITNVILTNPTISNGTISNTSISGGTINNATINAGSLTATSFTVTNPIFGYFTATSTTATSTISTGGLNIGDGQFVVQQNSGRVGIGTTTPWAQLSVNPNGITGPAFAIGSSTATDFIIDNAGRVGIGTTTLNQALNIQSGGINFNGVGTAPAATASLAGLGAGNLGNGTYTYRVAFVTESGESATNNSNTLTVVDNSTDGQISLTIPVSSDRRVIARHIYRTAAGAPTGGFKFFLTRIDNNTDTTFIDNIPDSSLNMKRTGAQSADFTAGGIFSGNIQIGSFGSYPNGNAPSLMLGRYGGSTNWNSLLSQVGGGVSGNIAITGVVPRISIFATSTTGTTARFQVMNIEDLVSDPINSTSLINDRVTWFTTVPSAAANTSLINIPHSGIFSADAGLSGGMVLASQATTGPMIFTTGGSAYANERMRILNTGYIGIGTTTPQHLLTLASSTAPQLSLSAGAGISQWTLRNAGGNLYFATTTTDGTATSTLSALTIDSNGRLGVGTTSPTNMFEVNGDGLFRGHISVGNVSGVNDGSLFYPGSTFKNLISAQETFTDMTTMTYIEGITNHLKLDPIASPSTTGVYAIDNIVETASGNGFNFGTIQAMYNAVNHKGSGTMSIARGIQNAITNSGSGTITTGTLQANSFNNSTANTVTTANGITNTITNSSSGIITTARAVQSTINNSSTGTITTGEALRAVISNSNASGNITTAYGLNVTNLTNAGTIGTLYGVYTGDLTTGTQTNTPYSFYASDTNALNYFAGNTGIGTTTPQYILTVASSTAPQLSLSAGAGISQWTLRNAGGNLYFATTTTDGTATSTLSALTIDFNGRLGIGTTEPNNILQVRDLVEFDDAIYGTNLGYQSGKNIYSGAVYNTFVGYQSGLGHVTDSTSGAGYNTGLGYRTLSGVTTGSGNTAIGYSALTNLNSGQNNTGIGYEALRDNTTGTGNVALGIFSLRVSNGSNNTALGNSAMISNSSGGGNVAIGNNALFGNLTGNYAVALGQDAGSRNTSAHNSVFIGTNSAYGNYISYSNQGGVYIGHQSGFMVGNNSDYNTFLGYQSGYSNTTGANNIVLGANIDVPVATGNQQLNIGNLIYGTGVYNGGTVSSSPVVGSVGIGTTTPWAQLSVNPNGITGPAFAIGSTTSTSFVVTNTGLVGINMTNPSVALDVTGSIEYTGDITDVSDERLKQNITEFTGGLSILKNIGVKNYQMISSSNKQETGFIAQNVQQYYPKAVSVIDPDNGYLGVSYVSFIPVVTNAIQELNLNLETIVGTAQNTTTESESFATAFFTKFRSWFADVGNGIGDFFANRVRTKEVCVSDNNGETCITKTQLDALLANVGNNQPQNNPVPEQNTDTISPVITLTGEANLTIPLNSSYSDLGATVTDLDNENNMNNNLGIYFNVNGVDVQDVQLDTSTTTVHTIVYSAMDESGNFGYATRTVEVIE